MDENAFRVHIYDENDALIYDSGVIPLASLLIDGDRKATWTPSVADWNTIKANPGTKRWLVLGEPTPDAIEDSTYYSEWDEFTILP